MKKILTFLSLLLCCSEPAMAQDDLFGTEKKKPLKGFIISLHGVFDVPMADMADRFGVSYRVGPSVFYKTSGNWMLGLKADFLFGNKIKEPGFLSNMIGTRDGVLNASGFRTTITTLERGFLFGVQAGKIFNLNSNRPDNGILALTSVGFMQHKILVSNRDQNIPQLDNEYLHGYDRLANGFFVEEFVGYNHFSASGLVNFNIGLNVLAGFTKGRRDVHFDTRQPGNESRLDMLIGVKGSWYIPIVKRKSEELFFE